LKLKGYLINDGYGDLVQHADKKELAIQGKWQLAVVKSESSVRSDLIFDDEDGITCCLRWQSTCISLVDGTWKLINDQDQKLGDKSRMEGHD
nr:hypothetical protein [Tanacetum cinerariifolium]